MRERLAVMGGLALFLGWHWVRIEQPMMSWRVMAALSVAAILPPLLYAVHRRALALIALVISILAVLSTATGFYPWERHHAFYVTRVGRVLLDGLRNWAATTTPIDIHRFSAADADVRVFYAVLIGAVAWALLVLRRPLLTILLSFVAFAVPATMVSLPAPGVRAALFLILSLLVFVACPRRTGPVRSANALQGVALGAAVLVAAAILANAPGVTKAEFLNWHDWNPLASDTKPVSVGYVWDQDYSNLKWPKKRTEVFQVTAPRPMYWKATTLNEFGGGRWFRRPDVQQYFAGTDQVDLPTELLPPRAAGTTASDIVRVTFTIKALADPHLLSAEQPVSYDLQNADKAELDSDGSVLVANDPGNGASYTVRAYTPDPTPQQLKDAGAAYPQDVRDSIRIGSVIVPAWGSANPTAPVALSADYLRASDHIWHASGADGARSPYEAVVDVEAYLRSAVFTYDQTPNYKGDLPPLVDFMTRSHRGYCQMFSGSMALILRLHGIPARVAVGFTQGTAIKPGSSTYTVTDHDAHSWVESYFAGYGWLPFDPTKSRSLPQKASSANPNVAAWARLYTGGGVSNTIRGAAATLAQSNAADGNLPREGQNPTGHRGGPVKGGGVSVIAAPVHHRSLLQWIFLACLGVIGLIVVVKQVALRRRYLQRGPRGLASACFHDVATFAGDQGMDVGPTMSYDDLATRLRKGFGVDASEFARLGTTARYGPPAKADEAAHGLRAAMRRVKRDMRRELNLGDRALGAVRLRSALSHEGRLDV